MKKLAYCIFVPLFLCALMLPTLPASLQAQSGAFDQFSESGHAFSSFTLEPISMNEDGLVIELQLHDFTLDLQEQDGQAFHELTVPGMAWMGKPGDPQVPSLGEMIGTPIGGVEQIRILEIETETRQGINLLPIPTLDVMDETGDATSQLSVYAESYRGDEMHPSAPVQLGMTGKLREQPFAQLRFNPFQYNPSQQTLLIHRRIKVAVDFKIADYEKAETVEAATMIREESPYAAILQSTLLNHDALPPLITGSEQDVTSLQASSHAGQHQQSASSRLEIIIDKAGIYHVPFRWMQSAGFDLENIDPHRLALHNGNEQVAIDVTGEADGQVDPDGGITFYGQATESQFSSQNVYWLSVGESQGQRIQENDGSPVDSQGPTDERPTSYYYLHTERWEINREYWKEMPILNESDTASGQNSAASDIVGHWYWERISAGSTPKEFSFTLANVLRVTEATTSNARLEGRVTVRLHGRTETKEAPDHHTIITLNGREIDNSRWDGQVPHRREIQVSQNLLLEGINTLKVIMPGDTGAAVDSAYLDYFEVTHWSEQLARDDQLEFTGAGGLRKFSVGGFTSDELEVYDLRDPIRPRRITNGDVQQETIDGESSYRIEFVDDLPTDSRYLVIEENQKRAPLDLVLVDPSSTDLDLKSTDNQADYLIITHADFADAVAPLAEFRRATGLVVETVDVNQIYDEFGDGTLSPQAIQDFLSYAYHRWRRPAPLYVLFVGDANYDYQDFLETGHKNVVPTALFNSPVIGQTPTDNWFVSVSGDDFLPDMFVGRIAAGTPDQASAAINKILAYESLPETDDWIKNSLFVAEDEANFQHISDQLIGQLPFGYESVRVYGEDFSHPPDATPQIADTIDQGASLITFIGHGSITDWYWNELVFGLDHIEELENGPNYPFLITGSCNNGLFAHPTKQISFAEAFVNADGRGGIGMWSPTGLGYTHWHEELIEKLFEEIFDNDIEQIGPATTAAKINAYAKLGWREPVEISTLFGDPALRLHVLQPQLDLRVKPITEVAYMGKSYQYEVVVVNNGETTISDLAIALAFSGSALVEADPPFASGADQWIIDQIPSRTEKRFILTVAVDSQAAINTPLQLTAQLRQQGNVIITRELEDFIKQVQPNDPDGQGPPNKLFIPLHFE